MTSLQRLTTVLGALIVAASPLAASAADTMSGSMSSSMADCHSMMMAVEHSVAPSHEMTFGADPDKNFSAVMTHAHEMMMAASKYEMSCGKNAKAKAMAKHVAAQTQTDDAQLRSIFVGP